MRHSVRIVLISLVVASTLSAGIAANAADGGETSMGNGGNAPRSVGVASSSAGDAEMTYIPAFDSDLPKGSAAVGVEPGPTSMQTRAASASSGPTWFCTVYASDPRRAVHSGKNSVDGEGWQSCTGTQTVWYSSIKVTIQRYLGSGLWQNKYQYDSGYQNTAWVERIVWYYCGGTGTQTYRIVTDGWQGTYHQAVQSLNYLKTTC